VTGRHASKAKQHLDGSRRDGKAPTMSQGQLETLAYLQNQTNLIPQQQQILTQLQMQYQAVKQAQARTQQEQQQQPGITLSNVDATIQSKDDDGEGDFADRLLREITAPVESQDGGGEDTAVVAASSEAKVTQNNEPVNKVSLMDIPATMNQVSEVAELGVEVDMRAVDIAERCRQWVRGNTSPDFVPVFGRSSPPPAVPLSPSSLSRPNAATPSKELLLPPTPSVHLENKKDAFSPQLQHFCLEHPIAVIRGIAAALKLDLGLFSTKSVSETHPKQPLQIAIQIKQKSDENLDPATCKQIWMMESRKSKYVARSNP